MSRLLILTSSFGGEVAMQCGEGVRCDDAIAERLLERQLARELKPKEIEPEKIHDLAPSPKKAATPAAKSATKPVATGDSKPTAVGSQDVPLADLLPFGLTAELQSDLTTNKVNTFDQLKAVKNLEKLKEIGRAKAKSIKDAMKAYEQAKETDSRPTSEAGRTEGSEVSAGEGSEIQGSGDQIPDQVSGGLPEGSGQDDSQD